MAANKKKLDEKHLKMLREMVSMPSNKQCFDCSQRGPTYVNMTIGSFVCTSCSGILRGLHPPHRIKSISMATFTTEEIDFLKSHGNEFNRKVYLGLHDNQSGLEPNSRDEQKIRDYMTQKYENKRWYVAPTDAMKEEAKWANETAMNSKPQVKTLRSLLGENATKVLPGPSLSAPVSHSQVSHAPVQVSVPLPGEVKSPSMSAITAAAPKAPSQFDFLADLGGDPFASNTAGGNSNGNGDGFADFSNFGSLNSSPSHQPAAIHAPIATQAFPVSATPLQPSARGQAQTPTTSNQAAAKTFSFGGDKYAALADLVGPASTPVTTAAAISWGGVADTGAINWGGSDRGSTTVNWGSTGSPTATPSQSTAGTSIPGAGSFNWNSQGAPTAPHSGFGAPTAPHSGFGAPTTGNPFGLSTGGPPAYPVASALAGNPFGASTAASQFSQTGVPPASGYNGQFAMQGQIGGYGQFPAMQNGGFGLNTPSAGYGAPGSFAQQQFVMPTHTPGQNLGGWTQFGASTGAPSVSNPFLNTAAQQQIQPPSGSTNPFL